MNHGCVASALIKKIPEKARSARARDQRDAIRGCYAGLVDYFHGLCTHADRGRECELALNQGQTAAP